MATPEIPEVILSDRPDRMLMVIPGLKTHDARRMANFAVIQARARMPKRSLSGGAASRLTATYGPGFFGVQWQDNYTWFQENGIRPFTMKGLAGKTIPMWIDDPTGIERAKNPKAKIRTTLSGKIQVLIFRKAAKQGQRKTVMRRSRVSGEMVETSVPMSYPGAPGRISTREAGAPRTTPGRIGGAIARGNGGVRWRHPGLQPKFFLNYAMMLACQRAGIIPVRVYVADYRWKSSVMA